MLNPFRNRYVIFCLILYVGCLAILLGGRSYPIEEAILGILILGFGFPAIAWLSTRRASPLNISVRPTAREMYVLAAYVVFISLYLVFGTKFINLLLPGAWLSSPQTYFFITLIKKLLIFVAIPLALFCFLFDYSLKDFGIRKQAVQSLLKSHLPVVIIVSAAMTAFQYFMGSGAAPIRDGGFTNRQLLIGVPLCFMWLMIEVGLVEEFFFRALLQSRLAAYFKSEVTGVALMALIFGLSHAPGFIFRQAGAAESIGTTPSVFESLAYSVVVLSASGIFLGIIWARTKNLLALMIIHAATDLLPNLAEFMKVWKI